MSSKKLLIYVSALALVFIVLALVGKKAGWFGQEKATKVATEKVQKRTLVEIITANGKIEPETEVKVTPDVSGEIVELNVKEGDEVKQGQLLLKIKPEVYMSARDQAEASVNSSKANLANTRARLVQIEAQFTQTELSYERNKKLWDQRTISESEWEQAQASYKVSKADVEAARQSVVSGEFMIKSAQASLQQAYENLTKTTIYAPMTGTITYLGVEKGERVVGTNLMSGTEMLRIANPSFMEAKVQVNENDIVRVSLRDTALIEVDAYLGKKFRGVVTEIANSANVTGVATDQVTNFDVKILLLESSYKDLLKPGEKTPFRPGMTATVEIQTETKIGVISLPIQAVTTRTDSILRTEAGKDTSLFKIPENLKKDEQLEIVYIPVKGKTSAKLVKTGIQDNNYIEIITGLNEGEEVITAPFAAVSKKLKIGSPIEIVDKKELFKEEK
jgi:HlyD family secretion protein